MKLIWLGIYSAVELFHSVDYQATLDSLGCFRLPISSFGVGLMSPRGYSLYLVSMSVTTEENPAVYLRGEGPASYHILEVLYGPALKVTAWTSLQIGKTRAWI